MNYLKRKISNLLLIILLTGIAINSLANAEKNTTLRESISNIERNGDSFIHYDLFSPEPQLLDQRSDQSNITEKMPSSSVPGAVVFSTNINQVNTLMDSNSNAITLNIPAIAGIKKMTVNLVQTKIYTDEAAFYVFDGSENGEAMPLNPNELDLGMHYQGLVDGEPDSMVAISVYRNGNVEGMINSNTHGTLNLGSVKSSDNFNQQYAFHKPISGTPHVIYRANNIANQIEPYSCGVNNHKVDNFDIELDDDIPSLQDDAQNKQTLSPLTIQKMALNDYIFTAYTTISGYLTADIGEPRVNSWFGSMFNQAAAVYRVNGITIRSSGMGYFRNSPTYDNQSGNTLLRSYNYNSGNFLTNSDAGILLTSRRSATRIAGLAYNIGGVCSQNDSLQRLSYAGVYSSFNNFPSYSWTVDVYAHEIGHTVGSRHTHACVWNNNNTAIDSCSGFTEGNCFLPGRPARGQGTIMSYCHQNVGKNFRLGFGSQPGNKVRSYVYYCAGK